jgi:hypothetical protein
MMHRLLQRLFLPLIFVAGLTGISAQTDFAPGQIMFTAYNSDDPDGFAFVILTDVVDGTVIYITDRGWSSSSGFRDDTNGGEGTISFEFTADYPCGSSFVFTDVGGTNDWAATDAYGVATGIVTILLNTTESSNQDPDGIEFNPPVFPSFQDGDQLFIYQLPEPNPSDQSGFVTGIHMNGGAWNGDNSEDWNSQKPTGLADNQVVRFNTEVDNAKYDCTPNLGDAATLQAAITNDNGSGGLITDVNNNWQENNNPISMNPICRFCCGTTPPAAAPVISAPAAVNTNQVFTINITGSLAPGESWELYTAGCGVGAPIQTTTSSSFTVTAPSTEGVITYYVRTSEEVDCEAICASVTVAVCIDINNMNLCTNCNANLLNCGDCFLPPPANNPDLDSGCYALRLIFVLDESGSIGTPVNYEPQVKAGVLAFLNSLNGQDAEVALIEFSDYGRLVNDYTLVNQSYIDIIDDYFDNIPYNGQTYAPGGGTNWHDAMKKVDDLLSADLLMFFTDGEPTGYTQSNGQVSYCGGGNSTETPEIVNPVKLANKIKSEGTHMYMLGVGNNVDELNLQRMSGFVEYVEGTNTLGTSDYSIGNFETLADDLSNFILELCRSTIVLEKDVLGPICNGQVQFRFRIINTGTESAATNVIMRDTFPSGYANPEYNGPQIKICIGAACDPPAAPNYVEWVPYSVPPGDTAELILTVDVLPTGNYTNTAWVTADNADPDNDTFQGNLLTEDLPPTITCPSAVTISCITSTLPATTGNPTSSNPDGPPPTVTYTDATMAGACQGEYNITRTWTATDNCLNTATCTQVIVVEDNIPPVVTCPPNITVDCSSSTDLGVTGSATASDVCSTIASLVYSDVIVPGPCLAEPTILRTWTATDGCGNVGSCVQTIVLDDSTPPIVICPMSISINCTESTLPANTGTATVKPNNCGGTHALTYMDEYIIQEGPPQCRIARTWIATDDCGNVGTCVQNILVIDNVSPTITCPANVTIGCSANTLPGSTGTATASDNCVVLPDIAYSDVTASGSCPNEYTITRTWVASDECGNSNSCVQTIVIDDSAGPTMTCPPNVTISCTANTLPAATGNATASDNCAGTPVIVYNDVTTESSACPQEYTITRTWTATDICNNSSTCVQTIVIDDSTAPTLTCPPNVTIDCTASTLPANTGTGTSSDNCDVAPMVTYADVTMASGTCPQEYTITRTWTATDECGNISTCNQTIVIDDSTAPAITCPANITIDCTASTLPANTGSATGSDNCDVTPAITFTDMTSGTGCPQEYTITRTWKATDDCGNSSTCTQTIVVEDNTAPGIICPPNITIECTSSTLPVATGNATSSDNCDAAPAIAYTDVTMASGTCAQEYTITRTWTSTDDCGNVNSCVQTIVVDDSTSPDLTCPSNITIECTANTLPANTGNATASDNCDATLSVTYADVTMASETCPQEYTITRTWSVVDDCGNTSSCVQTIVVDDSTQPVITCPANVTIECTAVTLPSSTGNATASDNCDVAPAVTYSDATASGACANEYTITRTWVAEDDCGNSKTCVQVITVDDSVSPVITCPADVTIQCDENTLPAQNGMATASDNCDASPDIDFTDATMEDPNSNGYFITRTWTATDACGNSSTCQQSLTVTNPLDPILLGLPFDTICSEESLIFEADVPPISPVTFDWSFGSGSNPGTETGIGPHSVEYIYNGTNGSTGAWVILTLGSPGCEDVTDTVANIHVNAVPNAAITASPGNPCILQGKTFQPTAPEMPGFSYFWNFGAGASIPTSNEYGPHTVEYFTSGSKTVKLIVTSNEEGASCVDSSTVTFTVNTCPGNITGKVVKTDGSPISGVNIRLFADTNLDGVADNGTPIRSVFTTTLGIWSMASLTPGYYVAIQVQPTGYVSVADIDSTSNHPDIDSVANINTNDNIIPVTVEASELDADNVFTEVAAPGVITGYVFEDFDADQNPDPIEGIPGAELQLYTDNNTNGIADPGGYVSTVYTDASGFYVFQPVNIGSYVVLEVQPANYTSIKDFDISNDADLVPNTNQLNDTIPVTVTNGETDAGNYFIESSGCSRLVTTTQDDVPGSLRYMMDCAEENDTIKFHPLLAGQTLTLTSGRLEFNQHLFIHSDLMPPVTIQSFVSGAFRIQDGINVEFRGLNIISGLSGFPGAAFDNYGSLTLWDLQVDRNALLPITDYLIFNGGSGILTAKGQVDVQGE